MKTKLYLILFLLLPFILNGQIITVRALNQQTQEVDSVQFGFVENATIEIDESLFEEDVFNNPAFDNHLKVLQRNMDNYLCLNTGNPNFTELYYDVNFDSKLNFRDPQQFEEESFFFQISIPQNLSNVEFLSDENMNEFLRIVQWRYFFENEDCNDMQGENILFGDYYDPIYHFQIGNIGNSFLNFEFKENTTGIIEFSKDRYLEVFPNPFNDYLFIRNPKPEILSLKLYNSLGQIIKSFNMGKNSTITINTTEMKNGIYLLSAINTNEEYQFKPITLIKN